MYKVIHNSGKYMEFNTREEAEACLLSKGRAKCFFHIEEVKSKKTNPSWKDSIDFTGAVQITRANVKCFYNKSGYIKVVNPAGNTLHIGKTTNMGKIFSNYVNCANYTQCYDFNLEKGDRLFFKEAELN